MEIMKVMSRYANYVENLTGTQENVESNVESSNYTAKEDMMLRGNNRKSVYNVERVRVGNNDRKRGSTNYKR
ncbi:hypothetical protein [Clostridium tagluense]|uniref:hypothetical protein n=1 Tax=Clostridium tagluense TaxID=360422 RepID=UPI001C0CB35A|nr:hypothetical protein [Clostridium tagluense]MBU3126229.1 hypothetical protein [Clostridium tagluense]